MTAEVETAGPALRVCPNCGEENPSRFRICGICGSALASDLPPLEVRKTVTIVFSDLVGSTALGEALETETLREVLSLYFAEMSRVLRHHGGTIEKFIGDAIMAVFGLPRLHEDDALRAVRAAADMQQSLERLNDRLEARWGVRLKNRTGVNTGEVVAGDAAAGQRLVTGDAVNVAARLEQSAPPTRALLSESTYRLVRDTVEVEALEPIPLRGKSEAVRAYLLNSVRGGEAVARRLDAPILGRGEELLLLEGLLEEAIEGRGARLATVLGRPGVGKSRLLREFVNRARERARGLHGRCLSYGDGITFWPLLEVMREAAGIGEDDGREQARAKLTALVPSDDAVVQRLEAVFGFTDAEFPLRETFWAARKLLEALARRQPLILVIDDIHWAEPTFLDLIRFVTETIEDAPVVLACSARPELLEERPESLQFGDGARVIKLDPLSSEDSVSIIQNVLGSGSLDESVAAKVVETAGGNPLFIEQIVSMLMEEGLLERDEDGWWRLTPDAGTVAIPPSISALLSARLDHLSPLERAVIERAAVVGAAFWRGAVVALLPDGVGGETTAALMALERKELITAAISADGEETYRFAHGLIRDAAYHGMLKRTRAELHERLVDWVETAGTDRRTEYEEIRGYHLEQAYLTRLQLGPADDHVRGLGLRGSRYLRSAGDRALQRGDMHAAANLLQRAAAVLPPDDPQRPDLLLHAGEALFELGEFQMADTLLSTAAQEASALGRGALAAAARLVSRQLRYSTAGEGTEAELLDDVNRTVKELQVAGDHAGLARAWRLAWLVEVSVCRYRDAESAAQRTIHHARLAGDRVMETRFLSSLAMCALYGPTPVPEAMARCGEVLAKARNDRKATALTRLALARLKAMWGDFAVARDLYSDSRASLDELGWKFHAALTSIISGPIEMAAGDLAAAEAELRRDYETLSAMGERNYISTTAAWLALVLCERRAFDEADRFTQTSEEIASEDDLSSQFLWRCARAKVLAQRGETNEGERLGREAVEIIERSDDIDGQGRALSDLAEVLVLAGRPEEALGTAAEAVARFEAKGNAVAAKATRAQFPALQLDSSREIRS